MNAPRPKRRTFGTYFVQPFKQIRFGLHVVSVSYVFLILIGMAFVYSFYSQYQQVIEFFQVANALELMDNEVFIQNAWRVGGLIACMAVVLLAVVIRRTHKMYGPMVNIARLVEDLKQGKYESRIQVRHSDDFQMLVHELNELASTLQKRHMVEGKLPNIETPRERRNSDRRDEVEKSS